MGLEEEEKKAKKGAAVLGRGVGVGWRHLPLPPERAPRPNGWEGSHIGSKDPETSKKLAGVLGF